MSVSSAWQKNTKGEAALERFDYLQDHQEEAPRVFFVCQEWAAAIIWVFPKK